MNPAILKIIVDGVFLILERHRNAGDPPPTPEEALAELQRQLADGQSIIRRWFVEKGLPPPA